MWKWSENLQWLNEAEEAGYWRSYSENIEEIESLEEEKKRKPFEEVAHEMTSILICLENRDSWRAGRRPGGSAAEGIECRWRSAEKYKGAAEEMGEESGNISEQRKHQLGIVSVGRRENKYWRERKAINEEEGRIWNDEENTRASASAYL